MGFKSVYILAMVIGLVACSTQKESNCCKGGEEITILIQNARPHCGGAVPDPEVNYPLMEAYISCTLSVHLAESDRTRGKKVGDIVTDHLGKAKITLKKGKYQLWKPSKLQTFENFVKMESTVNNSNYDYKKEDCYKVWYNRVDFDFEVTQEQEFSFAYQNRCFTGSHPCMTYSGPYPP